jgi:hypothetical protein
MRRLRLILVPAFVLSGGLILSACGGDSAPETPIVIPNATTTSGSLSKAEFITEADAICEEANTAIEQFAASGQGLTEADQIATLRSGVVDQIRGLGLPAEDQTTLNQFLDGMEAQVAAGQKIALASDRGEDTAQFESELDSAKSSTETAATAYGFQQCGQQITASGTSTTGGSSVTPSAPSAPAAPAPSTGGGGTDGGSDGGGSGGGVSPGGGGVGPG